MIMTKQERAELVAACKANLRKDFCDVWHDGDYYIISELNSDRPIEKFKNIHDLCYYCEVYEEDTEQVDFN